MDSSPAEDTTNAASAMATVVHNASVCFLPCGRVFIMVHLHP
jgi:hypothetical protein